MARYTAQLTSTAALAANTGFAWLMAPAGNGCLIRRVILGCIAGATTPTSQQLQVGFNRVTTAGTTPTGITAHKMNPNSAAAGMIPDSAFATPPTTTATDFATITFNSQSGVDLPFEQLEELVVSAGTANGVAFINRTNALPTSHSLTITVEWEE